MSEPENEFAELMARVRLGDNRALATLISLYEPDIRRTAHILLGRAMRSSLDPSDLVQSVHLQLILSLKQKNLVIGSPEQLRSLAVTLLRHRLIEHWRHHRCQVRHNTALAMSMTSLDGRTNRTPGDPDPVRAAEYKDSLNYLYRHLRAEDRRLIIMRLQGYRTGEIAAELGIGAAVVRVRLSRLRKRLRQEHPPTEWT